MRNSLRNKIIVNLCIGSSAIYALNSNANSEPPQVPPTFQDRVDHITAVHTQELKELNSTDSTEIFSNSIQSARITLRRVAIELAQKIPTSTDIQSSIELATLRLSISIPWLDECFTSFSTPEKQVGIPPRPLSETERNEALEAINQFSNTALETIRRSPMSSLEELDLALKAAFKPILTIIRIHEQKNPISHWPTTTQVQENQRNTSGLTKENREESIAEKHTSASIVILREFSRPLERRLKINADDPAESNNAAQMRLDLHRIQRTERWLEIIKTSSPSSYMGVLRQLKPLLRMLTDDEARANGGIAIDGILNQYESYFAMPLNDQLLTPNPKLNSILAGRGPEIHRQLSSLQIKWLDEFSRGRSQGDSAEKLASIRRLLTVAQHLMPLSLEREQIKESLNIINRWAAWYLPPITAEWMIRSLVPRMKLAATSVAEGEFDTLNIECDRLERHVPLAVLISTLVEELAPALQRNTGGPPGMIMSIALPPQDDSWLIDQREVFANLCSATVHILTPQLREEEQRNGELHVYIQRSSLYLIDVIKRNMQ